jgi:hypothetical protein
MARKEVDSDAAAEMTEETALVAPGETGVAIGTMSINMDLSKIPLPRLRITYGVGTLARTFTPGDLILGDDNLLVHKEEKLEFVPVTVDQYWKEYLSNDEYQAGLKPRIYRSEDECKANGGTTEWAPGVKPSFSPAVDVRLLLKQPENITCGLFSVNLPDGGKYAPAIFTLDKTAYRRAGEGLVSYCAFALGGNVLAGRFTVSTRMEDVNNNVTVVPKISMLQNNDEEMQAAVRKIFAGG